MRTNALEDALQARRQSYSPPQVGPRAKWADVAARRPTRGNARQHGVEILDVM
jgi:hypothetical protein